MNKPIGNSSDLELVKKLFGSIEAYERLEQLNKQPECSDVFICFTYIPGRYDTFYAIRSVKGDVKPAITLNAKGFRCAAPPQDYVFNNDIHEVINYLGPLGWEHEEHYYKTFNELLEDLKEYPCNEEYAKITDTWIEEYRQKTSKNKAENRAGIRRR